MLWSGWWSRSIDWPSGRVQAFVHGEAEEVMREVRPYMLQERGLDRDQLSASGYWRQGRSEEGFRAVEAGPGPSLTCRARGLGPDLVGRIGREARKRVVTRMEP
jgi:Siderophore-interacting protein